MRLCPAASPSSASSANWSSTCCPFPRRAPASTPPAAPHERPAAGRFEELSAVALRDRLLARRPEFWTGAALDDEAVRALHDPVFFHQLGGFGAVALTPDDEDAGYLLGVVSADRLAVVHALAVHRDQRGRGVATRLVERFATLAAGVGARAVQAVVVPGDSAAVALARRFGAHEAPSPGHAGPDADRLLLTRRLPLD